MSSFTPAKVGQVIVPISPRAIRGLMPQEIADRIAPIIIDAANRAGGEPIGAPEMLREDELRARTDDPDLLASIDDHPQRLWIVAEMVPAGQAAEARRRRPSGEASELVLPPLRRPRHRPR